MTVSDLLDKKAKGIFSDDVLLLVIFLTQELHNMSNKGIHFNRNFDIVAKRLGERAWLDYYGKTVKDFIERYWKNKFSIETAH